MLRIEDGKIIYHYDAEEVWIEAWGTDGLRIRATKRGADAKGELGAEPGIKGGRESGTFGRWGKDP